MKILFTPDLFKYEEEFVIEGDSLEAVIEKLQEECPVNCIFAAHRLFGNERTLLFLGVLKIEEGKEPKWINSELFIHTEE